MRIEADTLAKAFAKAAKELECSVTELEINIIQPHSSGFFGFFKKPAIIEVSKEKQAGDKKRKKEPRQPLATHHSQRSEKVEKSTKQQTQDALNEASKNKHKKRDKKRSLSQNSSVDGFFKDLGDNEGAEFFADISMPSQTQSQENQVDTASNTKALQGNLKQKEILDNSILETFCKDDSSLKQAPTDELLNQIKQKLRVLFDVSDFEVSEILVRAYGDDCVEVVLDGPDAALLIGKEGHRYKALSYILYNWINSKYGYSLRLEIASFLQTQEEQMAQYIAHLISRANEGGRVQSRPIDGVVLKTALERLRAALPNKYVGVKATSDGKCIIINEFNRKHQ